MHGVHGDHAAQRWVLTLSGFLLPSGQLRSPKYWQQTARGSFQTLILLVHSLLKWSPGWVFGFHNPFFEAISCCFLVLWVLSNHKAISAHSLRDAWRPSQSLERLHDPGATTICVLRILQPLHFLFSSVVVKVIWPWSLKMSMCQESFLCSSSCPVSLALFSILLTSLLGGSVKYTLVKMFCVLYGKAKNLG